MAGLEEHVTCSICMDLYVDPLALPCLHSFCHHCIQGLLSASLTFRCPECRKEIELERNGIDQLPKNFQLAGIVETYKKEKGVPNRRPAEGSDQLPYCRQHRMTCEIFCKTCSKPLCLICLTQTNHKSHGFRISKCKNGSAITGGILCTDHDRQFQLYCGQCGELVCLECVTKQHGGHNLAIIEDAYEHHYGILKASAVDLESRLSLLKASQQSCRLLAQKTQTDAEKKRQELTMYFGRLRESLDRRELQMKKELSRREQETVQAFMGKADDSSRKEKDVSDEISSIRRLAVENKMAFMKQYRTHATRASELLNDERFDTPPQTKGVDDVTLVTWPLEKELANISWKWAKDDLRPARKAPPPPSERIPRSPAMNKRPTPADWKNGQFDGGPGHVGSVIAVERGTDRLMCTVYTSLDVSNSKSHNYYETVKKERIMLCVE
ncbi:TRI13-like protein [Mya arenaria]|uniref:TRI13-like protein n=1 Tax=Mya arenaria TaxID=6604 RepID=A0ABY7GBE3_MYAAR|nr:TRI13-like protein [Mya arenaria]